MKGAYIGIVVAFALALRVFLYRRRRAARQARDAGASSATPAPRPLRPGARRVRAVEAALGDVGLVAGREIRERIKGRIFRVGTIIMLLGVGAAIVIPAINQGGSSLTTQRVGVVGALSPSARSVVLAVGKANQDKVLFSSEPSSGAARRALKAGRIDLALVDSREILLEKPTSANNSPADSGLVQGVSQYLGVLDAYQAAGLTPGQVSRVIKAKPIPVHALTSGTKGVKQATSVIGLVLMFFMLTQYCTWILIGVMQEKSSRVVEVLLAMVRPLQLLGGKVLGIGAVALGQATLIVGFALVVGAAVGSDLLKGAEPVTLLAELLWLVLGYAFYCWVYAAAGSTAERQDQVQTLALPLSLPILLGYIFSITTVSSGSASGLFKVLAYLPPTAPFCMSALVGLGQASWWEFVLSVLLSVAGTVGTALFAARVYRRAVLRTGTRVRFSEVLRKGRLA